MIKIIVANENLAWIDLDWIGWIGLTSLKIPFDVWHNFQKLSQVNDILSFQNLSINVS
jgi:hypothetical protein